MKLQQFINEGEIFDGEIVNSISLKLTSELISIMLWFHKFSFILLKIVQ